MSSGPRVAVGWLRHERRFRRSSRWYIPVSVVSFSAILRVYRAERWSWKRETEKEVENGTESGIVRSEMAGRIWWCQTPLSRAWEAWEAISPALCPGPGVPKPSFPGVEPSQRPTKATSSFARYKSILQRLRQVNLSLWNEVQVKHWHNLTDSKAEWTRFQH